MSDRVKGACLTMGGAACWGVSGCMGQYLFTREGMDSTWLVPIRLFLAGLILCGYFCIRDRKMLFDPWNIRKNPRNAIDLLVYGLAGVSCCQFTYFLTIQLSSAGMGTILQDLSPVIILLVVCIQQRRGPRVFEIFSILLALVGVFLITTHGSLTALALSPQALFWGLCAAVSLMLYTLLPGDLLRRYPVSVCTGCGMFIGGVVLLVLTQAWRVPVALNAAVALGTLEISVVGTALAFTLYLQGVSDVGGVRASLLACTEPVSAALCAALWLHTSFAWQDLLGFAAILVMAVLIALPERASEKSTEKVKN